MSYEYLFFRTNFEVNESQKTPQRIVTTHKLTNRVQSPLVL